MFGEVGWKVGRSENIRQEAPPERIQHIWEEPRVFDRAFIVETIAVEFGDPGCGDYDARWVAVLNYVESEEEGVAEGGREAVVRRGRPGEQIYLRGVEGTGYAP